MKGFLGHGRSVGVGEGGAGRTAFRRQGALGAKPTDGRGVGARQWHGVGGGRAPLLSQQVKGMALCPNGLRGLGPGGNVRMGRCLTSGCHRETSARPVLVHFGASVQGYASEGRCLSPWTCAGRLQGCRSSTVLGKAQHGSVRLGNWAAAPLPGHGGTLTATVSACAPRAVVQQGV